MAIEVPWKSSNNEPMPQKTGNYVYERVECIVVREGGKMQILFWNCEDECWDNEDDYECDKDQVIYYLPTSEISMP